MPSIPLSWCLPKETEALQQNHEPLQSWEMIPGVLSATGLWGAKEVPSPVGCSARAGSHPAELRQTFVKGSGMEGS